VSVRVPRGQRRVPPWGLRVVLCALAPLTVGVQVADSAPDPGRVPARALAAEIKPAPANVPNHGCPAKPQYRDTHAGQDFLCSSAANKVFRPGPLDVVWATGPGATIWAQNNQPNEIHGVAGAKAWVDRVDCPVHGIPKKTVVTCPARRTSSAGFGSWYRSGARPRASAQIIPASPVDGPFTCTPSPRYAGISRDGWIGWSWQKNGPCYYLIPPDVHCTGQNGQLIVDAQAPQMAAVDANRRVVDWQFVAWSMVIYKQDATTQPATWKVIQQTPFYWSKPTDIFDVPLSAVASNSWRLFSAANDASPVFSTHAGTFRIPSPGTYTFNFSYQWYGAPSAGDGLKPLPASVFLEFVSGYHLNARSGATVVPVYPNLTNLAWDPAACDFAR